MKNKIFLGIVIFLLLVGFAQAATFTGWVKYDNNTLAGNVNITVYDAFNVIAGEPWSNLSDSSGYFVLGGINETSQATYTISMHLGNGSTLKVGPIVPPLPAMAFTGMAGPMGVMTLNNLNWTLRSGSLINFTMYNSSGQDMVFCGYIKDKRLEWPLDEWIDMPASSDCVMNRQVYVPQGRNYTVTVWSNVSPPRGQFIPADNISTGIYNYRVNSTTTLVNLTGFLVNSTPVSFTRVRAYWLMGGEDIHLDGNLDGSWAVKRVDANGTYGHEVPSNTELLVCGYANSSATAYYGGCTNISIGATDVPNINISLSLLAGAYSTAAEPNTSKVIFDFYKRSFNGTDDILGSAGSGFVKIKTTYGGRAFWWGLDTNATSSLRLPIQNNSNISIKMYLSNTPPRQIDFNGVISNKLNLTLQAMDQMVDDQGAALDAVAPVFYRSNSTCDSPTAPAGCILLSFSNTTAFNPFQLMTLGGNISVRLTLPSGVILHYVGVDILAGSPDMHKPSQTANNTKGGSSVSEVWAFGGLIPREMYQKVLVGVPYNTSLVSESNDFKLSVAKLYTIDSEGTWTENWDGTTNANGTSVPTEYQDYAEYGNGMFNVSKGGILCSKTNTSSNCYVDLANNFVWFTLDHFSALGPQIQTYADLGNITSAETIYSCWPDSAGQGCSALVNLTINPSSIYANIIYNLTLNNTATTSGLIFTIERYNGTEWIEKTQNNTMINNTNLTTSTPQQFRINITLPYALSTRWNLTFSVNNTNYSISPWLDSINLTRPLSGNITTDQTPDFNFTLFSQNWTSQTCNLSLQLNGSSTWTVYGNNVTTNGTAATITASTVPQGNYTWRINCSISGASAVRWIYIDDVDGPTVSLALSSKTSTSLTIAVTTASDISSCATNRGSISGSGSSWTVTDTGLSSGTAYSYTVTCTDTGANSASSSNSYTTDSSGSSGSSGASGGSRSSVAGQFTKNTWTSIYAGETATIKAAEGDGIGVTEVRFRAEKTVYNVIGNVKKVEKEKMPAELANRKIHTYLEIALTGGIKAEDVKESKIFFKIAKKWLADNALDKEKIALYRYADNKWNALATKLTQEDETTIYYSAETPGFSYFAIAESEVAAEAIAPIKEEQSVEEAPVSEAPAPVQEAPAPEVSAKNRAWLWTILIIVLAAIIITIYFWPKKKGFFPFGKLYNP